MHVKQRYVLDNDDDEGFSVEFTFDHGRKQLVGVHRFTAFEQTFIEFRTYVCHEADMELREALTNNDDFVLGALALDTDGDYALLYSTPIAPLSTFDFDLLLQSLARQADKLETQYAGTDQY